MRISTIVVAIAAVPIMSFGVTYGLTRDDGGRGTTGPVRVMPACTGGHQRAMDGWSCTDWVLIDPGTGAPTRRRAD